MARRRNEAVSAAIQRVEADAASRDAARIDVRGSVRQNLVQFVGAFLCCVAVALAAEVAVQAFDRAFGGPSFGDF